MECQVGKNIAILRKKRHIRQEDLAEIVGVSVAAVCKWETGKTNPDLALLPVLAKYFGVTIDSLFSEKGGTIMTKEAMNMAEQDAKEWEKVVDAQVQMPSLPSWGFYAPSEESLCLLGNVREKAILEIGCGSGKSLAWLGEKGTKELWGLDISSHQIKQAKELLRIKEQDATLFVSPMELNPGIPHHHFDLVFCIDVLGWSVDLDETITRVAEYLKSGGRFVFSWDNPLMQCIDAKEGQYVLACSYLEERDILIYKTEQPLHMHHWKLSTYLNCLADHGFLIERIVEESDYDKQEAEMFQEGSFYSANRAKMINSKIIVKARKL